jgi:hypothetical protein
MRRSALALLALSVGFALHAVARAEAPADGPPRVAYLTETFARGSNPITFGTVDPRTGETTAVVGPLPYPPKFALDPATGRWALVVSSVGGAPVQVGERLASDGTTPGIVYGEGTRITAIVPANAACPARDGKCFEEPLQLLEAGKTLLSQELRSSGTAYTLRPFGAAGPITRLALPREAEGLVVSEQAGLAAYAVEPAAAKSRVSVVRWPLKAGRKGAPPTPVRDVRPERLASPSLGLAGDLVLFPRTDAEQERWRLSTASVSSGAIADVVDVPHPFPNWREAFFRTAQGGLVLPVTVGYDAFEVWALAPGETKAARRFGTVRKLLDVSGDARWALVVARPAPDAPQPQAEALAIHDLATGAEVWRRLVHEPYTRVHGARFLPAGP